jgi:transcriptional regulator with XRE-family HTH domain
MNLLNNAEVGERLRSFREGLGISSRKFAMQANIDPSQYAKIEVGALPLSEKILIKLVFTYKKLEKDYILFGRVTEKQKTDKPGNAPSVKSSEVLFVAEGVIRLMPKVSSNASAEQQIDIYRERDNKYLMVIDLLKSAINNLQNDLDRVVKERKGK